VYGNYAACRTARASDLDLPELLQTKRIILHITGGEKRAIYEKAPTAGPIGEMPIRSILNQKDVPLTVFWSPV